MSVSSTLLFFDGVYKFARFLGVFQTLWKSATTHPALTDVVDLARLVEDHFGGEIKPGHRIRVRGILSPYIISSRQPVYNPRATGPADQRLLSTIRQGRRIEEQFEIKFDGVRLPPPVISVPHVSLAEGRSAKLAWLYPTWTKGLILPENPAAAKRTDAPVHDTFRVTEEHEPIPVLLAPTRDYSSVFHKRVELLGRVITIPPDAVAPLSAELDPLMLAILSNAMRPFLQDGLLAIDLTDEHSALEAHGAVENWPVVISVHGVIETPKLVEAVAAAIHPQVIDAIPDRSHLLPFHLFRFGEGAGSVISAGRLRWLYNEEQQTIAAYATVNCADAAEVTRTVAELAHHWQAWQRKARRSISEHVHTMAVIRPITLWDPGRIHLFNKGGMNIPPSLEKALYSDARSRAGIDWLKVAVGAG